MMILNLFWGFSRIRFAPPLVIEEADLKKAINIIGECLNDLDTVSSHSLLELNLLISIVLIRDFLGGFRLRRSLDMNCEC